MEFKSTRDVIVVRKRAGERPTEERIKSSTLTGAAKMRERHLRMNAGKGFRPGPRKARKK